MRVPTCDVDDIIIINLMRTSDIVRRTDDKDTDVGRLSIMQ